MFSVSECRNTCVRVGAVSGCLPACCMPVPVPVPCAWAWAWAWACAVPVYVPVHDFVVVFVVLLVVVCVIICAICWWCMQVIAKRLLESKTTVPHYYLSMDVCADDLLKLRETLNAQAKKDKEGKVGLLAVCLPEYALSLSSTKSEGRFNDAVSVDASVGVLGRR